MTLLQELEQIIPFSIFKKDAFEYLMKLLINWKFESYEDIPINDKGEIVIEDFDRYKVFKLHFFVTTAAASPEHEGLLTIFDDFRAYQAGPVCQGVYDLIKKDVFPFTITNKDGFIIDKSKYESLGNDLPSFVKTEIENSLDELKLQNSDLINKNSSYLIDLSHEWKSWKEAKIEKENGESIDDSEYKFMNPYLIKYERKIFHLYR